MSIWTVDSEFEQPVRHINQTSCGGSFVAVFTLRLAPCLDDPAVVFTSEVDDPETQFWIPSVIAGILEFEEKRRSEGRSIGYLRVALIEMCIHLVDSKRSAFKRAAIMAMTEAMDRHGLRLE